MLKISFPKKKLIISVLSVSISFGALAQGGVGIGTENPDQSALLELNSNTKGLLLPRMSKAQRLAISNPAPGLMVYQTGSNPGLFLFQNNEWATVGQNEAKQIADNLQWGTTGNTGIDETQHFLGTTDQNSLAFRVNNFRSGLIDTKSGNLFLGYKAGLGTKGFNSVALGALALQKENYSGNNIAIGFQSLFSSENGGNNVALGTGSLAANSLGNNNVALGSLAGFKAMGSSNVFLGFQAGYEEIGDNKLVIANNINRNPLIYGDFEQGKLGINTTDISHTLTIKSNAVNSSGLRFIDLTNSSPVAVANGKVLSVNAKGEVILVEDQKAGGQVPSPAQPSYWKLSGADLTNTNSGKVQITTGLQISNFKNMSNKILGLDNLGNIIPVDKPAVAPSSGGGGSNLWGLDDKGNITPSVPSDILVSKRINTHGLVVGWGGITFSELTSHYADPFPSNGLALSLDETGHFILTKMPSTSGDAASSVWKTAGDIIHTPGNEKVAIGAGINSLPDGYSLFVRKGILTERLRVAMANSEKWADYVFEKDYKLMPLPEVEAFVKQHAHLPNVPSAQEVTEQGIDMAEMAAKQMEKIEELTLYLIEANKRIDTLEKKMATMH